MTPESDLARDLVMRLPGRIRVGLYDFTIQKWEATQAASAQRFGECSCAEQRIAVQRDMPTRVKAADTMLHEVGHAVWWAFGVEDADKEERTVSIMSSGMATVYRDNPWLLDWLKEALA